MFAIWGHEKAAEITYYGLHALQHRGQDGAGIVVNNGKELKLRKDVGLVNEVFNQINFQQLDGHAAIGNIHYATNNESSHVQPHLFQSQVDSMAITHIGNIINAESIRGDLEKSGSIFQTKTATELLAHLMKRSGQKLTEHALMEALQKLVGAYAFIVLQEDKMLVALDPRGIRPLSIGKLGEAYVISSETCAFDMIGAKYVREVIPGELMIIDASGLRSMPFTSREQRKLCAMEYVYFSRPDSDLNHVNVHASRKRMGIELAKEASVDADVVIGVPDSSISAAIGYAEYTGLPYELGLIKNRYVGRTFIAPSQQLREQGVKMKLSPVRGIVSGKRVIMIDDSIIRGTTCKRIVNMLLEAGATEVHVRIASPPATNPCYYGIDMSTEEELMAANHAVHEICHLIGATSLAYLSSAGMEKAIVQDITNAQGVCQACFTGQYPVKDERFMQITQTT